MLLILLIDLGVHVRSLEHLSPSSAPAALLYDFGLGLGCLCYFAVTQLALRMSTIIR